MLYPADRFDAHFLAALDLMQLPWGGLENEAVGAWDALADAGARPLRRAQRRHRDHQPRDPRHRLPRPGAAGAGVAGAPRHRDPRGALGPRPGAADPGRVAGERQAPPRAALRALPRPAARPGPRQRHRLVVLGRAGDPRHPRPLGRRPAARAGARGDRAPAGRSARRAVAAVQPDLRPRRPRPRRRGGAGQPLARASPRPRWCAGSTSRPTRSCRRRRTGPWCASCSPTRPCRAGSTRRG